MAAHEPLTLARDVNRAIELIEKLRSSGDIPPKKLEALQKVLQSEFCNAIREVYEHVYETVEIQGNPEVRAQATAKVIKHATSFFFNFLEFSSQP